LPKEAGVDTAAVVVDMLAVVADALSVAVADALSVAAADALSAEVDTVAADTGAHIGAAMATADVAVTVTAATVTDVDTGAAGDSASDLVIRGTAAITAIRMRIMELRITIRIIRTRVTTIRIPMALRHSSTRHSSNSTALRRTVLRNSSNSTALHRMVPRNSSLNIVKDLRRLPRSKPRRNRTQLLAMRRRLRNPAATTARMASGIVLGKSRPSKAA
jgi:hypothetical protein